MITRAQREALYRIWKRDPKLPYRQFRRTVVGYIGGECIMVQFANMWVGIERNGYTHS